MGQASWGGSQGSGGCFFNHFVCEPLVSVVMTERKSKLLGHASGLGQCTINVNVCQLKSGLKFIRWLFSCWKVNFISAIHKNKEAINPKMHTSVSLSSVVGRHTLLQPYSLRVLLIHGWFCTPDIIRWPFFFHLKLAKGGGAGFPSGLSVLDKDTGG